MPLENARIVAITPTSSQLCLDIPKKRSVCQVGAGRQVEFLCETEILSKCVRVMRKYFDAYLSSISVAIGPGWAAQNFKSCQPPNSSNLKLQTQHYF